MRDWFFYQERGQTMGPITIEDLRSRIRHGSLRPFDLIYKEGEKAWKMAFEHPDVRADFKGVERSALKGRPWVCLKRKKQDSFDFVTAGPFSQEEVTEHIRAGKLSYNDYAWQEGFKEWQRIGSLPEFNERVVQREEPPPVPEPVPKAKDLLKNVVELKRQAPPLPDQAPVDADGPDLTKMPPPIPDKSKVKAKIKSAKGKEAIKPSSTKKKAVEKNAQPPPIVPAVAAPRPPVNTRAPGRRSHLWADWGVVLALVLVLGGAVAFFALRVRPSRVAVAPQSVGESSAEVAPSVNSPVQQEVKAEAEMNPVAKRLPPPTQLSLSVQGSRSEGYSRIEVRSNATTDFPVFLQVVGAPGQVSSGAAFYRYLKLTPTGDIAKPLDLGGLQLPAGKFAVRAETGSLRKEALLNLGTVAPDYRQAVARQRKFFAAALWTERLSVYRVSHALEKSLAQALNGGRWSGRGLESLNTVFKSNGGSYLFFDDWWELKQIYNEARARIHPSLVERARRVRERMASFTVWKK